MSDDSGAAWLVMAAVLLALCIGGVLTVYRHYHPWPPLADMAVECRKIGGTVVLRESDTKLVFDRCIMSAKP